MSGPRRRWLVPEVLQTSLMDCGPAALKAMLEGFDLSVRYDRLRERCETDVDGTSIDALARLGGEFGLHSQQLLVPRDHFLLPEARCLPAIVVTQSGGGLLHFIVVWRKLGPFVQILDPGSGRRWLHERQFLRLLPDLPLPISIAKWRRWAGSADARAPWRARLCRLGASRRHADGWIERAARDASWHSLGTLDAAARLVQSLIDSGALRRGREAVRLLDSTLARPQETPVEVESPPIIPPRYWWVTERGAPEGKLLARGSVIVHCAGRRRPHEPRPDGAGGQSPPEEAREAEPRQLIWGLLWANSRLTLLGLLCALLPAAALVPFEAYLLQALPSLNSLLALDYQRALGLAAVLALGLVRWELEGWCNAAARRLGRDLETRVRIAFLHKLPRLEDNYLRSRPSSDMAGRGHALQLLREVPMLWSQAARALLAVLAHTAALLLLQPQQTLLTLVLVGIILALPYLGRRSLVEANQRLRTHSSALERFFLDALIGVSPIRVHGGERAVRSEHEQSLVEWSSAAGSLRRQSNVLQAVQLVSGSLLGSLLVALYVAAQVDAARLLLLAFWALRIPASAVELAVATTSARGLRSVALRLLSPLSAPDMPRSESATQQPPAHGPAARGVQLSFSRVRARVGGHTVIDTTDLEIAAGSHVGIVGASGAGKSSLFGLLLGWLAPSEGQILVDGKVLDVASLHEQTAWVDPAVQLWDLSLLDNLTYGDDERVQQTLPAALSAAGLNEVLTGLRDGMQTSLGEAGVRLSGGQGQRVRLGRALMRPGARLVLLDEPFRGLERQRRRELLRGLRAHFPHATLLFISHDVEDTLELDRVLVVEAGRVLEDGVPSELQAAPHSRFAALSRAARDLRDELWSSQRWRRLSLDDGHLEEAAR